VGSNPTRASNILGRLGLAFSVTRRRHC